MNILDEANKIINERSEEKVRQYGPFIECNARAAKIASLLSGKAFTTLDIYHFQIALKLAREAHAHKQDNLLDAVAYIGALDNYYQTLEPSLVKQRMRWFKDPDTSRICKGVIVASNEMPGELICIYNLDLCKDQFINPSIAFETKTEAEQYHSKI